MAVFHRLEEAELARGLLESDGIPVALLDAQMAALGLGPAVGGVRLLVPAWDEARALELLAPPPWSPESTPTPAAGGALDPAPTPAPGPARFPARTPAPGPARSPASRRPLAPVAWALAVLAAAALGAWLLRGTRR